MHKIDTLHDISGGISHFSVSALSVCGTVYILALTTQKYRNDEYFKAGFASGRAEGYKRGYTQGEDEAQDLIESISRSAYLSEQYQLGLNAGIDAGYSDGLHNKPSPGLVL